MDRPAAGPHELEALLARAPRVRALARGLCADAAAAEDLAQDALVVALEHPGAASAPLAWFRRVLERLAIDRARSQGARHGRERRVARGEAQPSTHDLVARAELQRRLVEEVLALPEPYRETLLERWFEERTPEQIARRLGVNASTVRTRLARGHALLRERLERREGRNWLPALAALGRSREVAETSIGTGGLLVATGTKLALFGIVLALGALWFGWSSRPGSPGVGARPEEVAETPEAEAPDRPGAVASAREEVGVPERVAGPSAPELEELSEAEAAALELTDGTFEGRRLRGLVLRGRTPIPSGTAWLAKGNRIAPSDPRQPWAGVLDATPSPDGDEPRSTAIGPDGRFEIEYGGSAVYTLAIDAGEGVVRQQVFNALSAGRNHRTVVIVLGSATIAGRVFDEHGSPCAGARVVAAQELFRNDRTRSFATVATTDAAGAYTLRDLPAGTFQVGVRRDGDPRAVQLDEVVPVDLELGRRSTLDFGRARALPVWSGVLRARTGDSVHGVWLTLTRTEDRWTRDVLVVAGDFRIAVVPGTYRVTAPVLALHDEHAELAIVELDDPGLARDLELPGTRLRGLALDAATGSAWSRSGRQSIAVRPRGHDHPGAITTVELAPDGSFVFDGLWPGEWVLGGHPFVPRAVDGGEAVLEIFAGEVEVPLTVELAPPD